MSEAVDWAWTPQYVGLAAAGWMAFLSLAVYIVRRVLNGRLRPGDVVDRDMARVEKQRDDAIDALRESIEVSRLKSETIQTLAETTDRLADGQDVIVKLVHDALPPPRQGAR